MTNMRGVYSDHIADHVFAYILTFARGLHVYLRRQLSRAWQPGVPIHFLPETTLGIVGLGGIGAEVARRGRFFGMRVLAVDPSPKGDTRLAEQIWGLDGLSEMLGFYRDVHMKGCRLDEDEDILLFHWGGYHGGEEETFEVAIARQLIVDSDTNAEAIWQLTLSFEFPMTDELQELDSGQEWCYSPEDLAEYEKLVLALEAYTALKSQTPVKAELLYECVG